MTRSTEDNMSAVAGEVNQMDVDYGKNFKILNPNDQIKGKTRKHIVMIFLFDTTSQLRPFRAPNNLARQNDKPK
jgi:hypothetical protein